MTNSGKWLFLLLAAFAAGFARAEQVPALSFEPPGIGEVLGSQIGEALAAVHEHANNKSRFAAKIGRARSQYFRYFPDKPGFAEAEANFARRLYEKDLYYLQLELAGASTSALGVSGGLQALLQLEQFSGGQLDDGIPSEARREFSHWVAAITWQFGGNPMGASREQAIAALKQAQPEYEEYRKVRDAAEFSQAGISQQQLAALHARRAEEKRLALERERREAEERRRRLDELARLAAEKAAAQEAAREAQRAAEARAQRDAEKGLKAGLAACDSLPASLEQADCRMQACMNHKRACAFPDQMAYSKALQEEQLRKASDDRQARTDAMTAAYEARDRARRQEREASRQAGLAARRNGYLASCDAFDDELERAECRQDGCQADPEAFNDDECREFRREAKRVYREWMIRQAAESYPASNATAGSSTN